MEKTTKIANRADCLDLLKKQNIPILKLHEHAEFLTMEDMGESKTKNFQLILAKNETKIDKSFWKQLGINPNKIYWPKIEQLQEVLGVVKGAVNPFSLFNDTANLVKNVLIDINLKACEQVSFHPNDNTATVELKTDDFIKFLEINKKAYSFIKLEKTGEPEKEKEK